MAMKLKTATVIVGLTTSMPFLATSVSAQLPSQVGAMVTLALSDPAGSGEPWRVQRQMLRTWTSVEACERQKQSFVGYHIGQVQGYGLVTPSGKAPLVEVESVECFTTRE